MVELGVAKGARPEAIGLAGTGNLILTCSSTSISEFFSRL